MSFLTMTRVLDCFCLSGIDSNRRQLNERIVDQNLACSEAILLKLVEDPEQVEGLESSE